MDFFNAVKYLKCGGQIRRVAWDKNRLSLSGFPAPNSLTYIFNHFLQGAWKATVEDIEAKDWILSGGFDNVKVALELKLYKETK